MKFVKLVSFKRKGVKVTTIYYGGGTPTSITAEEMDMLYEEMYEAFPDVKKCA